MKSFCLIFFLFVFCCQDICGQCIYSADYTTANNFCDLDSLYLTAVPLNGTAPFTYLWETGETTQTISIPLAFGDYLVTITDAEGCSIVINCHIKPFAEVLFYPFNQNACGGDTVTLWLDWFRDSIPGATYLWSTGETTPTIEITDDLVWSVTVTDPATGCEFIIPPGLFDFHPTPYPEIIGPTTICPGQSITLSVTGGPFGTIIWYPGGVYEPTLIVTQPDTYIVWTSSPEAGYCWHQDTIIVVAGDIPPPLLTGPPELCDGQTGTINITNSSDYLTFLWETGGTTPSITVTESGTYSVTVTDEGGCTAIGEYTIDAGSGPNVADSFVPSTCGEANGSINITPSPSGSYTYEWSNGSITEDLSNITGGIYTVTVTSPDGCTTISSITLPDNPITINLSENISPNTTCLNFNGAIDLMVNPSGTYSYLWSNGATTQDLTNLTPGSYSVTVTLGITCITTSTFIVPDQSNAPTFSVNTLAATCGEANGIIDLFTSGGTPPYTFIWSNGTTSEDLINITAGNYYVTVTGADGCTYDQEVIVSDSIIDINISGEVFPNTSCVGENGAIDIYITPPQAYSFLWSNGETTEDLSDVSAGSYSVTATLGLTCFTSVSFVVGNDVTSILITGITTPNSSCSQPNGAIDISVDPIALYTYSWSSGQTTEDLQQLTGGTYSVTVTGEDGCTNTATFDIINTNSNFSFTGTVVPNTSCSTPNGAIDLTVSPTGSYTFLWSNGASSEDLQNLSQGIYGVTVSDMNSCSAVASFLVGDSLSMPVTSALLSPATCNGSNGAVDLNVTPTIGNTFLWSNGSTTEDLSNLSPGSYAVTVTGVNGCVSSDTFLIINQNSNFTLSAIPTANNSCLNPNGSIDLSVSPSATYSFIWSNAAVTEDVQNLAAGNYAVTVTDILNCSASDTFTVLSNTTVPFLSATITPAVCGAPNGAIDLMVVPAINNSYLWSNGAVTEDLVNVSPSSYSVIVTDASGCQALDTFDVTNLNTNFSFSAIPVSNTSCTNPNGSIDMSVTPAGTYTFLWSNGTTAEDLANLSAGSYTVTVTDATSCSSTGTFVVTNNTPVISISSIINPSVCGTGNGSIDLTISPSAGNIFIWSNGALTEDVQNLIAGNFSVTVTDPGGCFASDTFTVPELGSSFTLSGFQTANTNCIAPNGSIDLTVIPVGVYSYIWSNNITSEDQASLTPGTYTVTVSDANGCSSSGSFIVVDQTIQPVIIETIVPTTCGNANGQIDITISPAGSYLFVWSNGAATEDLSNVPSGMYAVTVTDMNGCSAATSLVVQNTNSNFSLTAIPSANTSCTQSNGAINLTVTPSGTYTFLWSNGATSEDLVNVSAGSYTVTVSDATSCSSSGMYLVDDQTVNLLVVETITPVLCGEANGSIDLEVTPPSGNNFNWSNGSTTEDIKDILPGQYSVTVTAQNGCVWTSGFNVPGSEKLEIELEVDAIQSGDAFVTLRAQVNVPLTALDTILWLPDALFDCNQNFCLEQTISRPAAQTEIKVIAIDTNGCLAQASLRIDEVSDPKVYIPNVFSPDADGINDLFTVYGNKDVEMIDELQIFDRWGNQVFVNTEFPPNEENYGWDGSFKNLAMNPAVFAYWARVRYKDGTEGSFRGDVTLVR